MAKKSVAEKKGLPIPEDDGVNSNFNTARDIADFEKYFKEIGFSQVKYWY